MYYCHTRYFVPEWGRWLNADHCAYLQLDIIGGMNLFVYFYNDPIIGYDPNGTFIISIGAAITGLFGLMSIAIIETTFHPIENAIKDVGDLIGDAINNPPNEIINSELVPAIPSTSTISASRINGLNISLLANLNDNIYFSKPKNGGKETDYIGKTNEELEELLAKAKREKDSKAIMKILREMKIRGMRNKRKQRGGPHMRGLLLLLFGGQLFNQNEDKY